MPLDLTPFDFTPTESLVYEVLITRGPGTGYAVARAAGLAVLLISADLEELIGLSDTLKVILRGRLVP